MKPYQSIKGGFKMRKKVTLFLSVLTAVFLLVLLPGSNALTARAESNTYSVKFFGGDINGWRYVDGNEFPADAQHQNADDLRHILKEGDAVVVFSGDASPTSTLNLGNAKLSNLTIMMGDTSAVVHTGGIKDCYILEGAYAAINGDVTNAYLYDYVTCNFNNNVLDLTLYVKETPDSDIACLGTVGHFYVEANGSPWRNLYDLPAGALIMSKGAFPYEQYSSTPSEAYLQARAAADGTTPAATPAPAPSTSSDDEYDKVPKTGDNSSVAWLLWCAAALLAGSRLMRRKVK